MQYPLTCAYCGTDDKLSIDHPLARSFGGWDSADNTAPLLLVRRYFELVLHVAEERGLLELALDALPELPFDPNAIPLTFPAPPACRLWVEPSSPLPD